MLRRLLHCFQRSALYRAHAERARRRRDALEIADSNLFDRDWYLSQNPSVRTAGLDPIMHYLGTGGRTGRNPNPLFDRTWYLTRYPDVAGAGLDPLLHYARYGGFEGRDPNPLFDSDWYLAQNPDVAAGGINPLAHYILHGAADGRTPNRLFKSRWYVDQYPEAGAAGTTPLAHYLENAHTGKVDPNPWFDSEWYLRCNPEAAAAGLNPLAHYILEGAARGRAPSPLFKGEWYLENMPDLGPAGGAALSGQPAQAIAPERATGGMTLIDIVAQIPPGESAAIERLRSDAEPSSRIGRITIVAPPNGGGARTSAVALGAAVAAAKTGKRHLLVLFCGASITAEHIALLAEAFAADPLIGYIVPRLAQAASGRILPLLPPRGTEALRSHDPRVLDDLPASQIAPEFLSGCVLIRDELVCNFPDMVSRFDTMAGALRALMTWGRRLGYRALITRNVVIPIPDGSSGHPVLDDSEHAKLIRLFPDSALADARFGALACHYREALLARARSVVASERLQIMFDCSGMSPVYNGTSECALGILDGVAGLAHDWHVTVHATAETISFHRLRERYRNFSIRDGDLTGSYTIAVRLSQPWSVRSIAQLHRHAFRLVFLMLDTIAWDVIYAASPEVEPAWALIAAHADGILHISQFTSDRFNFRFPAAPQARQMVTHLSCHYDEYVSATERRSAGSGHILLIGNDLEHKGLAAALETLPRAFPAQQFVVIGQDNLREANVTTIRSGNVATAEMERLFATARMLVFPSFYEGFGFPVVKGLGYGLDVVARRSDLLFEIGSQCAPRGRLVPFDDDASLVAAIGRIVAGQDVETVPLGGAIAPGGEPLRWRDVAGRILALADELAADPPITMHDSREAALRGFVVGP